MGGVNYIVTNFHVIRGDVNPLVQNIEGKKVQLRTLELANDRDLVRMTYSGDWVEPLSLHDVPIEINYNAKVIGNSQGARTLTVLDGKIQSIGQKEFEIDAGFVQGNSGSPVLSNKHGVMGVATYVTKSDS